MRNHTIRFVVILAILSIAGISVTQVYWVKRAFDLKEAEFHRSVSTALMQVAERIYEINAMPAPQTNPVEQISTNYYIVSLSGETNVNVLGYLLKTEFQKRNLETDFEFGVYDCSNQCMVYGDYVALGSGNTEVKQVNQVWPQWVGERNHFGIRLVNRESHLLNQMGIWLFSTIVMMVVIIFFGYTLFVILKQKRLSEIQRSFINNITHEFKTPMSTISVAAEVLKNPQISLQPERLMNYATLIEKENNHLRAQVDRVMQLARIERDEFLLKPEVLNLVELIRESISHMELVLAARKGTIRVNFSSESMMIRADKLHLSNVVNNLLDNAINYTEKAPDIQIDVTSDSKRIKLVISDQGIGINPEELKKIFRKFYRVPTGDVHNVKGFGIGLNYVKTIVKAHRGNVIAYSAGKGMGSTFTVELPTNC